MTTDKTHDETENQSDVEKPPIGGRRRPGQMRANYPYIEPGTGRGWSSAHQTKEQAEDRHGLHCGQCGRQIAVTETVWVLGAPVRTVVCFPACPKAS